MESSVAVTDDGNNVIDSDNGLISGKVTGGVTGLISGTEIDDNNDNSTPGTTMTLK